MMSFKEQFSNIIKNRLVGAATCIVKEGKIVEEAYFGKMSLELNQAINLKTIFRIASISKIIVAMAALKLIEAGKANLDDDIGDILGFKIRNPYYPDDKITIRMLMTQTSSITDGYDDENPLYDNEISGYNGVNGTNWEVSLKDLLVPSNNKYYTPLTYDQNKPGTKFIYSNFGCGILACIVEALSGELFTTYVEKTFFEPLGIDASFRACDIEHQENIASLYYPTNDFNQPYRLARSAKSFIDSCYPIFPLKENFRGPAGGLFISMLDLSKLMILLMNDGVVANQQLLSKETVDLMLQIHYLGPNLNYSAKGLQLRILDFEKKIFKGHTGSAYGVISYLFFNKEENIGICFITNGGYFHKRPFGLNDIQEDVLSCFIQNYFPQKLKKHQFKFRLTDDYGYYDKRKVIFPSKPFIEGDEIYLPLISLASALNIVPKIIDKYIYLNYSNNNYRLDQLFENQYQYIPLKKTLDMLKVDYQIGDYVIINLF